MKTLLQRLTTSKLLSLSIKLALTLAAFGFVFANIDIGQLHRIWLEQDHVLIAGAVLMIICQLVLGTFRWQLITVALSDNNPGAMPYPMALRYYYISSFFNCCLPGTVGGDVVRVWLAKSEHLTMPLSIYSVLLDRVLSLLSLAVLIAFTLPIFSSIAGFTLWPVVLISAAFVALGIAFILHFESWFSRFRHFRLYNAALYFINCMKMLLVHKKASLFSLLHGVVAHLSFCVAGLFLAESLGIEMTWLQAITLLPIVLLVTVLPISIGGWGVREAGAVGLLGLIGVAKPAALMLSIQIGLINVLISLPGGLLWLATRRQKSKPHDIAV